ncbi:hypothetical protein EVAR_41425_1 [Eumeta japonica]|uniref:Uncharacterized protein n=1 Tax=Eumeta variegata TaxID=151549 RepID=A0A4C1W6A3_EUMVA|nr:hypothetical protein EVAR_41425_1 [Eumeta japonica]
MLVLEPHISYLKDKIEEISEYLQTLEPNRVKRGLIFGLGYIINGISDTLQTRTIQEPLRKLRLNCFTKTPEFIIVKSTDHTKGDIVKIMDLMILEESSSRKQKAVITLDYINSNRQIKLREIKNDPTDFSETFSKTSNNC